MNALAPDRRFAYGLLLVVAVAILLREQFVLFSVVEHPIRGDIRQYVAYATNLLEHGTFSSSTLQPPTPDGFRGPGYPAFLAVSMWLGGASHWATAAIQGQVAISALSVGLLGLVARPWLGSRWSLAAAGLLCVWPHHIAATGALLTEVVFGFLLLAILALLTQASGAREGRAAALAGVALGAATSVNPVAAPFTVVAAAVSRRRWRPQTLWIFLAAAACFPAAWATRNALTGADIGPSRAAMNFVEGSWPQYHAAWAFRFSDPGAAEYLRTVVDEERLLQEQPALGLRQIRHRLSAHPAGYLRWYLLDKPQLLWDWDIRMGAGDVYELEVLQSPLDRDPVLASIKALLKRFNPYLFLLACIGGLMLVHREIRRRSPPIAILAASLFVYLTAVHSVFQAEPRYATAYRSIEILLALSAMRAVWAIVATRGPAPALASSTRPAE